MKSLISKIKFTTFIFSLYICFIADLTSIFSAAQNVNTSTKVNIVGYYGGYNTSTTKISDIPSEFNVLIFTFENYDSNGNIIYQIGNPYEFDTQLFKNHIASWKSSPDAYSRDKYAIFSIGGRNGNWPDGLTADQAYSGVSEFIDSYGLDGVEINMDSINLQNSYVFNYTINSLKADGKYVSASYDATTFSPSIKYHVFQNLNWIHPPFYVNSKTAVSGSSPNAMITGENVWWYDLFSIKGVYFNLGYIQLGEGTSTPSETDFESVLQSVPDKIYNNNIEYVITWIGNEENEELVDEIAETMEPDYEPQQKTEIPETPANNSQCFKTIYESNTTSFIYIDSSSPQGGPTCTEESSFYKTPYVNDEFILQNGCGDKSAISWITNKNYQLPNGTNVNYKVNVANIVFNKTKPCCSGIDDYSESETYFTGDQVCSSGTVYECNEFPFNFSCSIVHPEASENNLQMIWKEKGCNVDWIKTKYDCCVGIEAYSESKDYKAGDKVCVNHDAFECKPFPFTSGCSNPALQPGSGHAWSGHWTYLECNTYYPAGGASGSKDTSCCHKFDTYSNSITYSGGDVVCHNDVIYQCKDQPMSFLCSDPTFKPGEGQFWSVAWVTKDCSEFDFSPKCCGWISGYSESASYKAGDLVCYNGIAYQCKGWPTTPYCSNPNYKPTSFLSYQAWTAIDCNSPIVTNETSCCDGIDFFTENGNYIEGDQICYNNNVYECSGFPTTAWCSDIDYAPTFSTIWRSAWTDKGCASPSPPDETPSIITPDIDVFPTPVMVQATPLTMKITQTKKVTVRPKSSCKST